MENKNIDINSFTLNLRNTIDGVSMVRAQFEEEQNRKWEEARRIANRNERMLTAIEKAAENTDEIIANQKETIARQDRYINLLEKELKTQESQLEIINDIFSSSEDSVLIEKEILRLIREEIDDKHPLWDFVKDKGGDVAVTKAIEYWPLIKAALKALFLSSGANGAIRL